MKKLFALLLLAPMLFSACGDDEEEKPYYNPVEGEWVYTTPMGNTETRIYTKDFNSSSISVFNGEKTTRDYGKYTIDKNKMYFNIGVLEYKIEKDTLTLIQKSSDWEEKYIRKK